MMLASQLPHGLWGEALMHAVWMKNKTWTRVLPSRVMPYELVMGNTLVLRDIPEWGAVVWVHDTSSGKLSVCTNEGHWVRYDLNSDGHRVYWKERCTVTIEHNIIFSKEDLPHVDGPFDEGIMDEPEEENEREYMSTSLNHERIETTTTPNENIDPPNPENSTMPDVRRSTCNRLPSRYVRDITSGEFNTRSENKNFQKVFRYQSYRRKSAQQLCSLG